jgi:hypothetical protein
MKKQALWLSLALALPASMPAQVTVEVTQEQDQFLPGEAVLSAVRITNRSGQTLHFGAEADWLSFVVESSDGLMVSRTGEVPVKGEVALGSSKVATKRVDLAPYFSLTRLGRYTVTATMRIKEWNREVASPPRAFDIIEGSKIWEQEFGVPQAPNAANAVPEVRKYILQQANFLKGQIRLYLRLTDAAGLRVFRVFAVGPMVSFARPEPQLDKASNLHLLYQSGATAFSYTVCNPDGEIITRQTYDYIKTRPRLVEDAAGNISVTGGVRHSTSQDVPAAPDEAATNAAKTTEH